MNRTVRHQYMRQFGSFSRSRSLQPDSHQEPPSRSDPKLAKKTDSVGVLVRRCSRTMMRVIKILIRAEPIDAQLPHDNKLRPRLSGQANPSSGPTNTQQSTCGIRPAISTPVPDGIETRQAPHSLPSAGSTWPDTSATGKRHRGSSYKTRPVYVRTHAIHEQPLVCTLASPHEHVLCQRPTSLYAHTSVRASRHNTTFNQSIHPVRQPTPSHICSYARMYDYDNEQKSS